VTNWIQLEPEAHAFTEAAARSPLPFTLGSHQGRFALDKAQSGTVRKPAVDVEDLIITDGPSAQVGLRILRPEQQQRGAQRRMDRAYEANTTERRRQQWQRNPK
jgi:hypothetical protein